MENSIVLTTGIYDLIKDHVRRKKVTVEQESILSNELRNATQLLRKELPSDIVSVDRKVVINDLSLNVKRELFIVGPKKAKIQANRFSVLSDIGLATIGRKKGETVSWPTPTGVKQYEILEIDAMYQ